MSAAIPQKATIHIVDDDDSLRTAMARLLRATGYSVVIYPSAGEFLLAQPVDHRGCLLLDLRMPGPSGLDLQEALARRGVTLPIIFLTGYGDVPACARAMKAGAVDFLTKPVKRDALLVAIASALAREEKVHAARERYGFWLQRFESLTKREREVFEHVVSGALNKQIAAGIGAAERTVKAHRGHVMTKMGVSSLADLVRAAEELRRGGQWAVGQAEQ